VRDEAAHLETIVSYPLVGIARLAQLGGHGRVQGARRHLVVFVLLLQELNNRALPLLLIR